MRIPFLVGLTVTAPLLVSASNAPTRPASNDPQAAPAAADVDPLLRLLEGNARFVAGTSIQQSMWTDRRGEIAKGQHPFAIVVGCADSRVPPELVFDQGLGDLFVIRCAGNVLGDAAIASIEYAVEHLHCELVVVLGHERCGAVDAVLKGGELPGHLPSLGTAIRPACEEAKQRGGDTLDEAVRANVRSIVRQISTSDPILAGATRKGELRVVGARYDLEDGGVDFFAVGPRSSEPSAPVSKPLPKKQAPAPAHQASLQAVKH